MITLLEMALNWNLAGEHKLEFKNLVNPIVYAISVLFLEYGCDATMIEPPKSAPFMDIIE